MVVWRACQAAPLRQKSAEASSPSTHGVTRSSRVARLLRR
jgi:hypothetical protein